MSILKDFPNSGYKKMKGFSLSRGYRLQENKIRELMRLVDPEGVLLRTLQSRPVLRRAYQVAGPLSLWHIDGNQFYDRVFLHSFNFYFRLYYSSFLNVVEI